MTTGEKVGSLALLLAVSVGIYLKFLRKGTDVAEAAQEGGGGGGGVGGGPSVGKIPSVMVADVSPVIAVSSLVRPRPTMAAAPVKAPSIPKTPIAGGVAVRAGAAAPVKAPSIPKVRVAPIAVGGGTKVGADGYTWGND